MGYGIPGGFLWFSFEPPQTCVTNSKRDPQIRLARAIQSPLLCPKYSSTLHATPTLAPNPLQEGCKETGENEPNGLERKSLPDASCAEGSFGGFVRKVYLTQALSWLGLAVWDIRLWLLYRVNGKPPRKTNPNHRFGSKPPTKGDPP